MHCRFVGLNENPLPDPNQDLNLGIQEDLKEDQHLQEEQPETEDTPLHDNSQRQQHNRSTSSHKSAISPKIADCE